MAPSAKSRKGKKAWRKNIDSSEVETFLEEKTYQERRGPAAQELKDDQLFFLDTAADEQGAAAVVEGKRPAKRRREEAAARPLRSELVIQEAHKAKALKLAPPPRKSAAASTTAGTTAVVLSAGKNGKRGSAGVHVLDLWADDEDLILAAGRAAAAPGPGSAALVRQAQEVKAASKKKAKRLREGAAAAAVAIVRHMGPTAKPLRKSPPPSRVKAVAVDVPGCSFNPDVEQHQDALALLVASEVRKELKKELLPSAPPQTVEVEEGGRPLTELERLQEEAGYDDEDEDGDAEARQVAGDVADPNAISLADEEDDDEGGGGGAGGKARRQTEKKSKKDRNKEARRKAVEAELEERRRLKAQRRELQSLKEVEEQLREEEREKEIRRLRRAALLEERATVQPPRLGKLKFEPPSVQVLTSDEKTGSLRQVVPCAMLAADRFKSLQQRGLVEPRKPQPFKEKRRKVAFEKGARFEKAEAASTEVRELTRRNKKARRQAKAAEAAGGLDDGDW